jgi:hypothetical protein
MGPGLQRLDADGFRDDFVKLRLFMVQMVAYAAVGRRGDWWYLELRRTNNSKSEMRGFFASLRMTSVEGDRYGEG